MARLYKNMEIYQLSYSFVFEVYKITKNYPNHEQFAMVSQIRRAAISISANIAEGYERQYRKEYVRYLSMARGSSAFAGNHGLPSTLLGTGNTP